MFHTVVSTMISQVCTCIEKVHTRTYCVHTVYILSMNTNAGFRGLRRDEDMLAGGPVPTQPHVTEDDEGDDNPCTVDEEVFQGRPDADDMEEAITKFLDGMEGQEHSGFKDLHIFLGCLHCPLRREIMQCCTLRLWRAASFQRWMRRNRKDSHRQNYSCTDTHWNTGTFVHTVYIHDTNMSISVHTLYIHGTY
jgi:hypothetical protein